VLRSFVKIVFVSAVTLKLDNLVAQASRASSLLEVTK
jgi:hypothetical protein